jgi:hypothetical protein
MLLKRPAGKLDERASLWSDCAEQAYAGSLVGHWWLLIWRVRPYPYATGPRFAMDEYLGDATPHSPQAFRIINLSLVRL